MAEMYLFRVRYYYAAETHYYVTWAHSLNDAMEKAHNFAKTHEMSHFTVWVDLADETMDGFYYISERDDSFQE